LWHGATLLGQALHDYKEWVERIAGALRLHLACTYWALFASAFSTRKAHGLTQRRAGLLGAVVMGRPLGRLDTVHRSILGSIITLATQQTVWRRDGPVARVRLGLGLPFVLAGVLIGQLMPVLARVRRYMRPARDASAGHCCDLMGITAR
jgi:cytochrome c biogenesis protein CcdA